MIIKRIEQWKKWMTALLLLLCLALCAVLCKAYLDGKFDSVETLQSYISGFGLLAPVVLTAIQALQVVIPVLPLFPDDFFCYFTGITKMTVRKFAAIIVLGKPWCILAYSIFFAAAAV